MQTLTASPVTVLSCGRCGIALAPGQQFCTTCGSYLISTQGVATESLLTLVVPAVTTRIIASRLIDCGVVVLSAVLGGIVLTLAAEATTQQHSAWSSAIVGSLLGGAAAIAINAIVQSRIGRAVGGLITRIRTVDRSTGLPVPLLTALARVFLKTPRRTTISDIFAPGWWSIMTGRLTADLSRGRDPLTPAFSCNKDSSAAYTMWETRESVVTRDGSAHFDDLHFAAPGTTPTIPEIDAPTLAAVPAGAAILAFDSGAVHWFTTSCVIGRNPAAEPGVTSIAVPDLSRTLSKTHIALTLADGNVTIRDLNSTNGTVIERVEGERIELSPGSEVPIDIGTTVLIGDYVFRLDTAETVAE